MTWDSRPPALGYFPARNPSSDSTWEPMLTQGCLNSWKFDLFSDHRSWTCPWFIERLQWDLAKLLTGVCWVLLSEHSVHVSMIDFHAKHIPRPCFGFPGHLRLSKDILVEGFLGCGTKTQECPPPKETTLFPSFAIFCQWVMISFLSCPDF